MGISDPVYVIGSNSMEEDDVLVPLDQFCRTACVIAFFRLETECGT